MEKNQNRGIETYEHPREDKYDYCEFPIEGNPEGVLIAQQIQAESYLHMRIVRPEGLMALPDGARIIAPDVSNPTGMNTANNRPDYIEYSLGVAKGTTNLSPITGNMVAWRKYYAPLDQLPAYQFGKDKIPPKGERYLREIEANPRLTFAEPEALGKTASAGSGAIKEFIRHEIQRSLGKGEVWFMGLVEKTVYNSWVHNWGPTAVWQVGDAKKLTNPHNYDDVALVPTVLDVDTFYSNMAFDILMTPNRSLKRLKNFVYMSEGVSDEVLGHDLAKFRRRARSYLSTRNTD